MVPAIQLMLRVERDAEAQRRPAWEDNSDFTVYELIRPVAQAKRLQHFVSRFVADSRTMKVQEQGARLCNCVN